MSEKKLQELKNEEITKLSQRSQYVNRANKTMHFMRNRLGPFSNLLKMLDNFEKVPREKIDSFKNLLLKERDRAKTELINITSRANEMLEKTSNPFVYNSLEQISVERVFTILKRNFNSFFPENEIQLLYVETSEAKRLVSINEEGFELFLSDWLNNMLKYKVSHVACKFSIERDLLLILFSNDHSKSQIEINQLISDLTSNHRNEIMKRTTHGLYTIKSTLEDMDVSFDVHSISEQNILVFTIKFKILNNEDSCI